MVALGKWTAHVVLMNVALQVWSRVVTRRFGVTHERDWATGERAHGKANGMLFGFQPSIFLFFLLAAFAPRAEALLVTGSLFDFSGSVDVKVTYHGGTLTFTMEQGVTAPRKIAVRINNDWYTRVLHVLTNPIEQDAPQPTDANVYAINPGDSVPAELPAGKTVYYFKPGQHDLPRGLWLDVDLGTECARDRVQLDQGQTKRAICSMGKRYTQVVDS